MSSSASDRNDSAFRRAIETAPHDPALRLNYADWLDDCGDPRGELFRIQEELRSINVEGRSAKESRMHELLSQGVRPIEFSWTNVFGMEFLLMFPGEFLMGSPAGEQDREECESQVTVRLTRPFYLSRFPVTGSQWFDVNNSRYAGDDRPITGISWDDAIGFCKNLSNYRGLPSGWTYALPTEAQWEYCCRAGTTTRFFFGDEDSQLGDFAWFGTDSPMEVSRKHPNGWGLYDLAGNVWEMCDDFWQESLPGGENPLVRVRTEVDTRVMRGGCFKSSSAGCRSASRGGQWNTREFEFEDLGFRVAANPL